MYIVMEKQTNNIVYTNNAPLNQGLAERDVYQQYNPGSMAIGKTDRNFIPHHFKLDNQNMITELTVAEKVTAGILKPDPDEKLLNGRIVKKLLSEMVGHELPPLSPYQKIIGTGENERIVAKSLKEQVEEKLIQLSPYFKVVVDGGQETIVAKTSAELLADKVIVLGPGEKLENGQIVAMSLQEMVTNNQMTMNEFKASQLAYYSQLAVEKRRALISDQQLENANLGIGDTNTINSIKQTVKGFQTELSRINDTITKMKKPAEASNISTQFPVKLIT